MSTDRFTEITNESWFSRIGGALKGIVVGLILFVAAFPLLFWNEGRAVRQYKTLKEGGGAVVSVRSDAVDPANAGKLIHVTGKADSSATLTDPVFGVSAQALKLRRVVEMYQWQETAKSHTKKKLGGGTETARTFTYSKAWSGQAVDSADFKEPAGHQNPGALPYASTEQVADVITLGAFTLSPSLAAKIDTFEALAIGSDTPLAEALKSKAKVHDGGLYVGPDPASPKIGDVRVKFSVARPAEVSVIAKQAGSTFEPYRTKAGGDIELLQAGVVTGAGMIQAAQDSNKILTWILRLAGFVVMLVGLGMIFRPVSVLADVVPVLGGIVGAGTGLIAFFSAAVLSLITIAVAWMAFRPLLAILLIVVAIGLAVSIRGKLKPANAAPQKQVP